MADVAVHIDLSCDRHAACARTVAQLCFGLHDWDEDAHKAQTFLFVNYAM